MGEVEDRVADQLAGAVVGRLTTPVGPDDVDVAPTAFSLVPKQVICARGLAHGEHVRVLEQQQRVGRATVSYSLHQLGLEVPDRAVAGATQPAGSYGPGLVHQRGMRTGPEARLPAARSPWPL